MLYCMIYLYNSLFVYTVYATTIYAVYTVGQKGLYIIQYTVYIYVIVHELVYVLYIYKYV